MRQRFRHARHHPRLRRLALCGGWVLLGGAIVATGRAEPPPPAAVASAELARPAVTDPLAELREIQRRVRAVVAAAAPATVGLDVGLGTGSGVVVDEAGTILTAAHVIGPPGRLIQVFFPDGRVATARTLGSDRETDAGMARLQGEGPWPYVPWAGDAGADDTSPPPAPEADELAVASGPTAVGDWVVALGHPSGFDVDRPVTARLGRVVRIRPGVGVQSDCVLIGGDSGGPLLSLDGRVVGIHSRIGPSARTNIHVGTGIFAQGWDRLAGGERWGQTRTPLMGVMLERVDADAAATPPRPAGVMIRQVLPDSAADDAGLKRGDVMTALDGRSVLTEAAVYEALAMQQPGDRVRLTLWRRGGVRQVEVQLGERR